VGLLLAGCTVARPPAPPPVDPLAKADRLFAQRRFGEAAAAYDGWLASHPADPGLDTVLFHAALAHLSAGREGASSRTARALLRRLVAEVPDSPYRPAVEVLLGWRAEADVLREQLEELKAIDLRPPPDDPPRGR
jgi:hypothetical protein